MKYIVHLDLEDGEPLDFFWDEDEDPPPLVKPGKKEGDEKENEKKDQDIN